MMINVKINKIKYLGLNTQKQCVIINPKNLDILIEEEENTPAFKAELAKKVRIEGEIESIALLEKHEDLKSEIKKRIGLSDKKTTNDTMQDLFKCMQ